METSRPKGHHNKINVNSEKYEKNTFYFQKLLRKKSVLSQPITRCVTVQFLYIAMFGVHK